MHIFAMSGSLQPSSANRAVLNLACAQAAATDTIDIFTALGDVAPFDASFSDDHAPPSVIALRRGIAEADGVLIASPEYGHSMPGVLKNALDWLVGSGELASKPVAIITASPTPTGGLRAQIALIATLLAQSAEIVALLAISGSKLKIDDGGAIVHAPTIRRIRETTAALTERCRERANEAVLAASQSFEPEFAP